MRKELLGIILLTTLAGGTCNKDKLGIERQNYLEKNLRFDGIFYNNPEKAHFFLYRNGVVYIGGAGFNGQLSDLCEFYQDYNNYKNTYVLPYSWGVFNVQDKRIIIEKWVSGDAFGRYTTTHFSGDIINDTTLLLNYPAKAIGIDTFHFYSMRYKPDSINNFIR